MPAGCLMERDCYSRVRIAMRASEAARRMSAHAESAGMSYTNPIGTVMLPGTRVRVARDVVSFDVPFSLASWLRVESIVRVMIVPAVTVGERTTCRFATWLPGRAASRVYGTRLVDSWKVSSREIAPAEAGVNSERGVRGAVMPARLKVIEETAAAGE